MVSAAGRAPSDHPHSKRAASVEERLQADPRLASAAADMLGAYCRHQLESGDHQALADLGDLLWHDEPDLARTAFEHAIDAGRRRP